MNDAAQALQRAEARASAREAARKPIDYAMMNRIHPRQKAALTRAIKSGDCGKLVLTIQAAMRAWDEIGAWPDDWSRWQAALDDMLGWRSNVDIRDLRDG